MRGLFLVAALCSVAFNAFAQADVVAYGLLDVSGNYLRFGSVSKATGSHLYTLTSDASRLGFRGAEDLGGGQRAYFKLETGVSVDTGKQTSDAQFWNRESYLGLSDAKLGSVQIGSQFTPEISASANVDPFGRFGIGSITNLLQGAPRGWSVTFDDSVQYITPEVAGLRARALGSATRGLAGRRNYAVSIDYADGPMYATLNYQSVDPNNRSAAPGVLESSSKTSTAGTVYDFGRAKVHGWYQVNHSQASAMRGYMVGVTVPLERSDIRAAYVHRAETDAGASVAAVGYYYSASQRTLLFAQIGRLRNRGTAAFGLGPARAEEAAAGQLFAGREVSGVQIGIRQSF